MKVRPSVIIIENNHLLLLRYNYGGNEVFALPGGNPDAGETLTQTLQRELSEELNIDIETSELLFVGEVILPNQKDTLHCCFAAKIIGGIPELNPDQTTALEMVWKSIMQLHEINLYPNIGDAIQDSMLMGHTAVYVSKIEQKYFE